jgi:hypothetical protein
MRNDKVVEQTQKFACDGVTDDSVALAELFRPALTGESVRRSGKDDREPAKVHGVSENKVL